MAQPDYKPHDRSPLAPCPMDSGVVYVKSDCGCTIEGCGHLPDPVRPKLCAKHAAAPDLYAALAAYRAVFAMFPRATLEDLSKWKGFRDAQSAAVAALEKADAR